MMPGTVVTLRVCACKNNDNLPVSCLLIYAVESAASLLLIRWTDLLVAGPHASRCLSLCRHSYVRRL